MVGRIDGLFIMSFLFDLLLLEHINLDRWEDKSVFCNLLGAISCVGTSSWESC